MSPKNSDVTETELAILDVLWDKGPSTVRDIVEAMYAEHRPSLHATVKSLLDRLAEKGYVQSDASRFAHEYSATVTRESFVGRQLQQIADNHFEGALLPMLLTLVDRVKLSKRDRDAIVQIISKLK